MIDSSAARSVHTAHITHAPRIICIIRNCILTTLLVSSLGLIPANVASSQKGEEGVADAAVDVAKDLDLNFEPAPSDVNASDLARAAEKNMRSDRTYLGASMTVISPRLTQPRVVAFRSWEDSEAKESLIRIDKPTKDKGTGFLKQHPNLWMYVPRVERTVRVPPSMMLQSWMGSDFSNDDLVRESSEVEDYEHVMLGIDPGTKGNVDRRAYVLEYQPKETAAVVWGKIIAWLDVESGATLRQDFFDEDGERIRVMSFGDFKTVGKRNYPHAWSMIPLNKPGHSTSIEVTEIEYDAEFDSDIFTTRNLKRKD